MSRGGGGGKATPGKEFTAKTNRTVEDVAVEAYGKTGKAPAIWGANPGLESNGEIPKHTRLIIPPTLHHADLTGKGPEDLTVVIDGLEVPMLACKICRTMDTCADGWAGSIAWTPGESLALDRVTRPFEYPLAAVFIGGQLIVGGYLYGVSPEMTAQGMTKTLTGYSATADAIDSTVMPPYEFNNVTLEQLAQYYCDPFGINAVFQSDFGGPFARTTAHEGETIFEHLSRLAAQRSGLVSCTNGGDMLFHRAKTGSKPVGTLQEGQPFVTGWRAEFDGRKLFGAYTVITSGEKGRKNAPAKWGKIVEDKVGASSITEHNHLVPRSRFLTFRADDVTPGNIHNAAKWKRNKHITEALTITFPVSGWYAPNGRLWEVNTIVTVVSATLSVPKGFNFLIRAVEFDLESNKRSATLHLVPPQAYNGKDMGDVWGQHPSRRETVVSVPESNPLPAKHKGKR